MLYTGVYYVLAYSVRCCSARLSDVLVRGLASAGLIQILLDLVCLALSAAAGVDTLLGRGLLALSVVNILLTVLMIGKYGNIFFSTSLKHTVRRPSLFECGSGPFVLFAETLTRNEEMSPRY